MTFKRFAFLVFIGIPFGAVAGVCLLAFLLAISSFAWGQEAELLAEAEAAGLGWLHVLGMAIATGIVGVFVKRPQDVLAARRNGASRSAQAAPDPVLALVQEALSRIDSHIEECKEHRREARTERREESRRIYERLDQMGQDLAFMRGRTNPPTTGAKP